MTLVLDERAAFPTGREEAWKYTPVAEIVSAVRASAPGGAVAVSRDDVDGLAGDLGCTRLVFVNGVHCRDLSDLALPAGVRVATSAGRHLGPAGDDGFDALNAAAPGVALTIAPSVVVDAPIHIVHLAAPGAARTISHPRAIVEVGDGAELTVIETYAGLPGPAVTNASTTVRVGAGASFDHVRVQSESEDAIHVGRVRVEQAASSRTGLMSVMLGAQIARHAVEVRIAGADARTDLAGLYLARRRQRHDNVVTVDHAASGGTSTQHFRGVLDDHARGSFSGHVIVRPDTLRTDASQRNHNLVLSPTAEADTRPWLEIFADDVRCTHGATVGRLDDEALFYLRSRGIPVVLARAMLVDAFIAEITGTVRHAPLRAFLEARAARP
jgi:Fe-S cluster assembly protein SufD